MKLKKLTSVLLASSMVASMVLAGCGNGSGSSTQSNSGAADSQAEGESSAADASSDSGVEPAQRIVLFQSKVEITDALEEAAEIYKSETGLEVEVQGTTGDDYFQQLKSKFASNQGPTIFSTAGGTEMEQIKGYAKDLTNLEWLSTIADSAIEDFDGVVYGIPYTVEGYGLVYNKDLVDATAMTSTDDFISMIQEQAANGVEGFELSQESYFLIGHILGLPFGLQDDPMQWVADLNSGSVTMAENEHFQSFAEMMVAIRDNCSNPMEQNYDGEVGDLATGRAATIHQGNWCAAMFEDYGDVNIGLAPLPMEGNDKIIASVPTYWSVSSAATPEEQEAAVQFLTWLYTSESGKDVLYNNFGFIPLIEGDTSENLDPLSADVQNYVNEGKTLVSVASQWPAGIVDVYLVPVAQDFFTSDMSAEDFLAALDTAWADAVANASR